MILFLTIYSWTTVPLYLIKENEGISQALWCLNAYNRIVDGKVSIYEHVIQASANDLMTS